MTDRKPIFTTEAGTKISRLSNDPVSASSSQNRTVFLSKRNGLFAVYPLASHQRNTWLPLVIHRDG